MLEIDKTPRSGVPAGFSSGIGSAGLPSVTVKKRFPVWIVPATVLFLLSVTVLVIFLVRKENTETVNEPSTEKAFREAITEEITEKETEEVTEASVPEVSYVTVGNEETGIVEIPEAFVLTDFDLGNLSYTHKYAYKSKNSEDHIILLKLTEEAEINQTVETLASSLIPSYSVTEDTDWVVAEGESGGSRLEIHASEGAEDHMVRALLIIGQKESEIFSFSDTYFLDQGFSLDNSPYSEIPEGKQMVGDETLGYLLIGDGFSEDTERSDDFCKTWVRESEEITLKCFTGTPQDTLPLSEFNSILKEIYLGDVESSTGDWFRGAYYSSRSDDGTLMEMYTFKGSDGINRMLLISGPEGSEISEYYKDYVLPMGVKEEMD